MQTAFISVMLRHALEWLAIDINLRRHDGEPLSTLIEGDHSLELRGLSLSSPGGVEHLD